MLVLPPMIDTHAHVFLRGLPIGARARYVPGYDAPPDAYLSLLDRHGIAGAALVQPSFLSTDNSFMLACLREHRDRFRAVLVLQPDEPGALDELAVDGVTGIRLNLIGQEIPDLRSEVWQRFADGLAQHGRHLEIQARDEQWTRLAPALRGWPSDVVIDHLGLPGASAAADRAVVDLARRGHVWIKVSAPYRAAGEAAGLMLARLLSEAGSDRLLWGSDWPWTRHEGGRTYADCLAWLRDHVDEQVFQAAVAHNPARLLRWTPTPSQAAKLNS